MTIQSNLCRILIITVVILGSVSIIAAAENRTGSLTVVISDFPSSEGFAMVALSNSKESYEEGQDQAFAKEKIKVENAAAQVLFKDIPYGEYGISLYHDQNSNGKMDKNAMGIPKEAYAFSNSVRSMFGKPDWEKVRFELNSAEQRINITFK